MSWLQKSKLNRSASKTAGVHGWGEFIDSTCKGAGEGEINTVLNPLDTDSEGAIKSVRNNGVSVLSGFRKNVRGFPFPGAKQTVRNEVHVRIISGCL